MRIFGFCAAASIVTGLLLPTTAIAAPPDSALGGTRTVIVAPNTNALQAVVTKRFGATVRARFDASGKQLRQIFGLSEATAGVDAGARALAFANKHADLLAPGAEFTVIEVKSPTLRGATGIVHRDIVRLGHTLSGLPIEGRVSTVTLDEAGKVIAFATDGAPVSPLAATKPTLDAAAAAAVTEGVYRVRALPQNATLVVLPGAMGKGAASRLAWKVPTAAVALVAHFWVWIDAVDGAVLKHGPMGPDQGLVTIPVRDPNAR